MKNAKITYLFAFLFLSAVIIPTFATTAHAHRVNLFAYVEDGIVYTESSFSKKKKVHGGEILVFIGDKESPYITGKTDNNGEFTFPLPTVAREKSLPLHMTLKASQGHRNTWTIEPDEFGELPTTLPLPGADTPSQNAPQRNTSIAQKKSADDLPTAAIKSLQAEVDSLKKRNAQLKKQLIDNSSKDPGIKEILAGLGYIFGLFGLWTWFSSRKK
ncbi:MAG: hypothetical protein ACNI27_15050 [Desulfovibrio sp.]